MDPQQEQQIALGLRDGRTDAWRRLYDTYASEVWRCVARQMGPGSSDVADVVQETFLAAARSARTYDASRGSLWTWLGGIARRHVALHFRKQRRQQRLKTEADRSAGHRVEIAHWLDNREAAPGEALDHAELSAMVRSTLTALPADYEALLTAKYFDGATVEEIAGQENRTSVAVRSKLARARRAFRRAFGKRSTNSPDTTATRDGNGGDHES